ncbi:MAG: carbohydrate ABC transporter permease [Treponema sp.]|jgi:ABC-type glycerol-3-phosphate transport system permease component|nr:carbohydrate ABC transporter permease [Treponema sp.]
MLNSRKMRLSASDKAFYIADYSLLIFCGIVVLLPLLNVFSQALSDPSSVLAGRVLFWPRNFTLDTLKLILRNPNIKTGYLNTLFYASVGTVLNLTMTVACAYPLSRVTLRGRNAIMLIFTFTMMFGGGMIPTYILIKDLGLIDTRWVMIVPGAMTVWNMILARTFFQNTIPKEMYESAELDGAGHIRVLASIVLPLSSSILAVLTLFYAVGHWNSYFDAMMYLRSQRLFNIQLILRNAIANIQNLLNQSDNLGALEQTMAFAEASKYAIIVVSMVPVLVIYPFVQKHFIKGIMIGALKG